MNKNQVIQELKEVIKNIELDRRMDIKGIKVMVSEYDWKYKTCCNDSNLMIDWK